MGASNGIRSRFISDRSIGQIALNSFSAQPQRPLRLGGFSGADDFNRRDTEDAEVRRVENETVPPSTNVFRERAAVLELS